ncbi:putative acetyltransferase [Cocos nucifera]|nr:putative acetyltransferase [Cocos nucifera]
MNHTEASAVHIISKSTVLPSSSINQTSESTAQRPRVVHLTPWDLRLLSIEYIQKGVLLPQTPSASTNSILPRLLSSLSLALDHFFPLAGRLATKEHQDVSPPSLSIFIDCNDQGVELIHAAAAKVTVSDILSPLYVPTVVRSFFPLAGAVCHDGHLLPLLAVQVTELADGVFVGCSANHAVVDGSSFWHFLNSWSEISRTGSSQISQPPVLDRWFLDPFSPPIFLPFGSHQEFIRRYITPRIDEAIIHFSKQSIQKLKAKANLELKTNQVSSLQALLAHVWRWVVRARKLKHDQETSYSMAIGDRWRIEPPLPANYFGNSSFRATAKLLAGEVVDRGLGWVAWQLNRAVAAHTDAVVKSWLESWQQNPIFSYFDCLETRNLATGSSPRFDVYGNDFGWGRPLAVRSGIANKMDGNVMVYEGNVDGSMDLEISLSPQALASLLEDKEFMEPSI